MSYSHNANPTTESGAYPLSPRGTVDLNNYLQKIGRTPALAWDEFTSGRDHAPEWTCVCKIDGEPRGTGKGATKQEARNAAAAIAVASLRQGEDD